MRGKAEIWGAEDTKADGPKTAKRENNVNVVAGKLMFRDKLKEGSGRATDREGHEMRNAAERWRGLGAMWSIGYQNAE